MNEKFSSRNFYDEIIFKTSRSKGAGGQNVNKVNTKVEMSFHIQNSAILTSDEKLLLLQTLSKKINFSGFLVLCSQKERSQWMNKKNVIEKFIKLIEHNLIIKKTRVKTKPDQNIIEERLKDKRKNSEKKNIRKKLI
jgi:ribosome-associated protein